MGREKEEREESEKREREKDVRMGEWELQERKTKNTT